MYASKVIGVLIVLAIFADYSLYSDVQYRIARFNLERPTRTLSSSWRFNPTLPPPSAMPRAARTESRNGIFDSPTYSKLDNRPRSPAYNGMLSPHIVVLPQRAHDYVLFDLEDLNLTQSQTPRLGAAKRTRIEVRNRRSCSLLRYSNVAVSLLVGFGE